MNTYIVKIDCTHACEIRQYEVIADTPTEAALMAGALAGIESEGGPETFALLSIDEVIQTKKRVWG